MWCAFLWDVKLQWSQLVTRETLLLLFLFFLGGASWIFIELQDEVREGEPLPFDEWMLLWFREADDPSALRGPEWLEETVRDITALGGPTVLTIVTVGISGFFLLRRQFQPLLLMLGTVIGGAFLVDGLKELYERTRPEMTAHLVEEASHSFPSGHSTMATVVYLSLAVMLAQFQKKRRMRVYIVGYAALLAFMIGISRVILGVHYPSDVAAGWTVGVLWASLGWFVAWFLKRRRPALEESAE